MDEVLAQLEEEVVAGGLVVDEGKGCSGGGGELGNGGGREVGLEGLVDLF